MELTEAWNKRKELRAEGDKLWVEAIIAKYGNITLQWDYSTLSYGKCTLENGEVYE